MGEREDVDDKSRPFCRQACRQAQEGDPTRHRQQGRRTLGRAPDRRAPFLAPGLVIPMQTTFVTSHFSSEMDARVSPLSRALHSHVTVEKKKCTGSPPEN